MPDAAPATRLPLTRDRILEAAVSFADGHGIEALSMRKLARELGYEVMSLYNHVPGKDAVLDGMADLVAADVELPEPGDDWKAAVRAHAASAHRALAAHPWAPALLTERRPGPARLRGMEWLLRTLDAVGFAPALAHQAYHAIEMHIVGFTAQQLRYPMPSDVADAAAGFLSSLPPGEYPHVERHVGEHIEGGHGSDEFGFVLGLILDGLEREHPGR